MIDEELFKLELFIKSKLMRFFDFDNTHEMQSCLEFLIHLKLSLISVKLSNMEVNDDICDWIDEYVKSNKEIEKQILMQYMPLIRKKKKELRKELNL